MDVSTYLIQHLGIVAGIYDLLGIGEVIDRLLPKQRHHKVPHSIVVKAMILNGLGFTGQRLYLFPNFFKTIPVEELLGESITADDLNDDVLLRTLDAIYNYGATELFNEIVLEVMRRYSLKTQLIHVDTTNFSVYGKYENDAPDGSDSIKITFGHAKDGRTDLKRFVLGLVVNQLGIPLFAQAYSGNKSDKKSIIEMIRMTQNAITLDDKSIWIADSALYSEENIKMLGTETPWITRIPANVNQSAALLDADLDMTPGDDPKYAFYATELNYGDIPQKAVVVWSEDKQKRDEKTLDKRVQKADRQARKELKTLQRMRFACAPDAQNEAERWIADHPYHIFNDIHIVAVSERIVKRRGRPRKDEPMKVSYAIEAKIEINADVVADKKRKLGRFVLGSNKVDLEPETMLSYYKGQHTVERGFRFLKDKSFHVSEIYLKKEERIESLSMIMVLNLLVYSFAEWKLREMLRETGQTVPNQLNKPTQRPTMRWIFTLFMGVVKVVVKEGGKVLSEGTKLDEVQAKIIHLLGQECENYYGLNR